MFWLLMMMIIVQNLYSEFHQNFAWRREREQAKIPFFRIGRGGVLERTRDSPSCNDDITYGQAAVSSARGSRRIPNSEAMQSKDSNKINKRNENSFLFITYRSSPWSFVLLPLIHRRKMRSLRMELILPFCPSFY